MTIRIGRAGVRMPVRVVGPTPHPIKPPEIPFPPHYDTGGFRLGVYEVLEERDDYLVCKGWNPNSKVPGAHYSNSAKQTIHVAKPTLMQKTLWNAADREAVGLSRTIEIAGKTYEYAYSSEEYGVRTVTWTDDDENEHEEEERISIPYFAGDIITAVEMRENANLDGINVDTEEGGRLVWSDLNFSGRHWRRVESGSIMFTVLEEKGDYLLCEGRNPETGKELNNIAVAKPYLLQQTPWDGRTVEVDGNSVTYQYTEIGKRRATATIDGEEVVEIQKITEDYREGGVIVAERVSIVSPMHGEDEDGERIQWVAASDRVWAVDQEAEE